MAGAPKAFPKLPLDRGFSVAKAMQKKTPGDEKRTERKGNPGPPQPSEQFPLAKDKNAPFNAMDPHWQGSSLDTAKKSEKYYNKGEARQLSRRIPIGPGGAGEVVDSSKASSLGPENYKTSAKRGMR